MRRVSIALILYSVLITLSAIAGIDKIYDPYVEQGIIEFEYRGNYVVNDDSGQSADQKHKLAIGYGVNSWWAVEGYLIYEKKGSSGLKLDEFEVENLFQFSGQGEYILDYGMLVEIEKKKGADKWEVKAGPLLKKDIGRWSILGNFLAEKQYGNDRSTRSTNFVRSGQLKYRYSAAFEPALEYQGDNNAEALGAVIGGSVRLPKSKFGWQAGFLFGVGGDAADINFRWEIEWEF